VVLIQLLLPTTFPDGTASQDATAALAETRRELAETFDGLTAYVRSPAKACGLRQTGIQNRTMS
jgi:hypothetical protein